MKNKVPAPFLSRAQKLLQRSPLWLSFTALMALCLLVMSITLAYSNYRRGVTNSIRRQNESMAQMVDLKFQNLDQYLSELADFCVLPVNDTDFYNTLLSYNYIGDAKTNALRQTANLYYYSRTDLLSYRLSSLRHGICFARSGSDQRMKVLQEYFNYKDPVYLECLESSSHCAITPSENRDALFTYSHTIFRINDGTPIALVSIDVNKTAMATGFQDQITVLYNKDGTMLYTNTPSLQSYLEDILGKSGITSSALTDDASNITTTASANAADSSTDIDAAVSAISTTDTASVNTSSDDSTILLKGEEYLQYAGTDDSSGLTLVVLTPLSSIKDELRGIQISSLLQGLIFLLFSVAVSFLIIRYLTQPLTALTNFQLQVGSGEYPRIKLGRSKEAAKLGESFNEMSERIDRLVNDNLMSSLNEKNARIEALEAQVNPHFLYNTLQAIGSEALMNDEPQIYEMITRLASNMRYAINGSREVTLQQELEFVDNYIELQKLRMEDRLQVTRRIDQSLLRQRVPKCALQLIVENSIKYGLQGDISCLHLEIDIFRQGGQLVIRVMDNGAGMTPERLKEVQGRLHSFQDAVADNTPLPSGVENTFSSQTVSDVLITTAAFSSKRPAPGPSSGIGLANLCSRLKIMYDDRARIEIQSSCSKEDHHTCVTLVLDL